MLEKLLLITVLILLGIAYYLKCRNRILELDIESLTECRDELIRKEISTRLNYTDLEYKYSCLVEENNKLKEQIKSK